MPSAGGAAGDVTGSHAAIGKAPRAVSVRRSRARFYLERGQPVEVLTWWAGRGPRNVLIRRGDGQLVVRPFRGLRRIA